MLPKIEEHAPRARCYQCGRPEIASICHHCGRAMCRDHGRSGFVRAGQPVSHELSAGQRVNHTPQADKLVSHEFADLGLEDRNAGAYHCAEHWHVVKGRLGRSVWIGIGILAAFGILVSPADLTVALILLVLSVALGVGAYLINQQRIAAIRAAQPPLPFIPNLESISVRETLHGHVRLDKDLNYTSPPEPVKGQIEVAMTLANSDRERLEAYRRKHQLAADAPVSFSAGYCLIRGEAGIVLTTGAGQPNTPLPAGTGITIQGDVATHPLFDMSDGGTARQWTARANYGLHSTRAPESVPIWLVPSLVPDSDRRTLELDLHWAPLGDKRHPLVLDRFEEIVLHVPTTWGNVEAADPRALGKSPVPPETKRIITWNKPPQTGGKKNGSCTLTVRFEKKIEPGDFDDPDYELTGRLKATFTGTLSGIDGIDIYRPLGDPWLSPPNASPRTTTSVKTEVTVDFELSLNGIRYQEVRVVPDPNRTIENENGELVAKDSDRKESDDFAGIIPGFRTVIELTNAISDADYYVKRVIENPPRGGGRAGLWNRFWDIAGRQYYGVFPVDFHLTLTGEEQYEGGVQAHKGDAAVAITIQGSYVDQPFHALPGNAAPGTQAAGSTRLPGGSAGEGSQVHKSMEQQIEEEWDRLHKIVISKLGEPRSRPAASPSEPFAPQSGPLPEPSELVPQPRAADMPANDSATRATVLRQRLESATEAVLAGRISDETYREVKAAIQTELAAL